MISLDKKDLLDAGVHFGHLTKKWNPKMAPFIFMEHKGIHVIDLNLTLKHLQVAAQALSGVACAGGQILFLATKTQAKRIVREEAQKLGMPYVTERWLGGTLTNFSTIRRLIKKMSSFEKMMQSSSYRNMAKREQLTIERAKNKLQKLLGGISNVTKLPKALFIVDINREHIAVKEAKKLGIPLFAIVDTNVDPTPIDYPIPSNDDASRSIEMIVRAVSSSIQDGLERSKKEKEQKEKDEAVKGKDTLSKGREVRGEGVVVEKQKESVVEKKKSVKVTTKGKKSTDEVSLEREELDKKPTVTVKKIEKKSSSKRS